MNKNIQHLIREITDRFQPERIILFGSFAYGRPDQDSDIDLLVIMDFKGSAREQAVKVVQTIDYHFPLDLMVRSREQISKRIDQGDFFLREVLEKGEVLYDRDLS